jgi:hypothetical protein
MDRPGRTQKQIAERYKGNLGYYKKLHPWRRARLIVSLCFFISGLIAIWIFYKRTPEKFFNPGPLSAHHAALPNNCNDCHDKSLITGGGLTLGKFKETVRDSFRNGVASNRIELIDRKCEACHFKLSGRAHTFHEANVVQNRSCAACHQEHQGPAPAKLVASSQCASCHNNPATMEAAAQKGMQLPADAFHRHPHSPQQVVFDLPRPPRGYTQTFSSFWDGHPEFQLVTAKTRDPDVLRFNHQRHFASDIPALDNKGTKLDCNYCHKPQSDGRFYQRINFAANCQACHSLQFDAKNPELKIPHGDVALARTFLRTLPAQYADYARLKKGIRESEVASFAAQQIRQLREQFHSGDELERAVFFTGDPYKPQQKAPATTRANFAGCAFCHDVKPVRNAAPAIAKPVLVDRWMMRSDFNHAKHTSVKCDDCHHAMQSRDTGDVLMPVKANCVTCHSPAGKIVAACITCHTFHGTPSVPATVASVSVKQMLLGR